MKTEKMIVKVMVRIVPIDNGEGAVHRCTFHSETKEGECGALNVMPTKEHCRRCSFFKTREQFDKGLGNAARALRDKGLEPVKKMNYDGKLYMSVQPIKEDNDDTVDDKRGV